MNNLIDAGVIAGSHIDPETKKVSLMVNLTKDYRKIKAIIK
jgi:L-asparaginase/Glu-tRNA(Gln) amidotransferase subunit D